MPHKLDVNGKCEVCGYVKGSKLSIARQPKSVSAKVSVAVRDESYPYHVKNNTVTFRTDAKVFNGKEEGLGFNWYARVIDQNGNEIFDGAVEEMFRNDCFKDEKGYEAIYNGFDGPELTISVPFRACQWKYFFRCNIALVDIVNGEEIVLDEVTTDEAQLKAGHLYTVCENVAGSGAKTIWNYIDASGKAQVSTILSSDGHQWYCTGCRYTDKTIKTDKGRPVMHRYGAGILRGESVDHPGAKVYAKQCQDCYHTTLYETHQHVYYAEESDFEKYNRGTFQVDEEKTTNMAHALVCLVGGCGHIKLESHEWDWRHMGYGSDAEGGGTFYRECRICGYPDYDYRPVDDKGNKVNWTTKNVLVTAINAQPSRVLATEGDKLTLTINNNSETIGKRCTEWTVEYIDPDGRLYDITAYYGFAQKENGVWSTTVKLAGCKTGGYLIFTPTMVDCTSHEYVTEGYVASVCMYDGFAGYRVCKHCNAADPTDARSDEERVIPAIGTAHTGAKQPLYQKEVTLPSGKKTITWTINQSESNGKRYNYKEGSCTEKGCEGDFLCSDCQHVIPGKREFVHSDDLEWRNEVLATCGRNGYQGDGYCKDCGKFIRKGYVTEVPKGGHIGPIIYDYDHNAIDPTCTTAGKTSARYCYTCMETVADGLPIDPLGHSWVKDETNSTPVTAAYKCSRCEAVKFTDIAPERYSITVTGGTAYVDGKAVTRAAADETVTLKLGTVPEGKRFKEWEVVSGSVVIANATDPDNASFTMPGNAVVINAVLEDVSAGHTHTYGEDWMSDADNHWHECECGDKSDIAAHTASDWIIDTAATETENGAKHMKFIVEKEIFEKLPNACFGVVMAKDIDNSKAYPETDRLMDT